MDDDGWAQLNTRNDLDLSTKKGISVDTSSKNRYLSTKKGVSVDTSA